MIPLIDFDSIIYKKASSSEDFDTAIQWCEEAISTIEDKFSNKAEIFITGSNNFRLTVDPDYKISEEDKPKPPNFYEIKDYFISKGATIQEGYEAEDLIGIKATSNPIDDYIICGIDKDLKTIPGWNYNYDKLDTIFITPEESALFFWQQAASGDTSDDIKGLPGIGIAKAVKLLKDVDVKDYRKVVENKYLELFGSSGFTEFDKTCRLVFIKQKSLTTEYYHLYP